MGVRHSRPSSFDELRTIEGKVPTERHNGQFITSHQLARGKRQARLSTLRDFPARGLRVRQPFQEETMPHQPAPQRRWSLEVAGSWQPAEDVQFELPPALLVPAAEP